MLLARSVALCASFALVSATIAAAHSHTKPAPVVTREVIAIYFGTDGTDGGMTTAVRDMRTALAAQATAGKFRTIMRGVSLDPSVEDGLRHLAKLGTFDEVSLGGNWGNAEVVRYLGGEMGKDSLRLIPQVVLLERDARLDNETIEFGPEHELARYHGTTVIQEWVRRGAPIKR